MKSAKLTACLKSFQQLIRLPLPFANGGFTLIEILVVVLIIGILGAIALPQYQRAVLKSRYAALMPIAKSMADSNEAYYLEYGEYADNAEDLPVQGRMNYQDGTELEFGTTTSHAYVLATRDNNFPNNYIVYQKHSEQYPGEIHCEAASDNTLAQDVCKSFGPTEDIGETLTPNYLTYVLFGTGNGVAPTGDNTENDEPDTPVCAGVSCDDQGNITECASGQTLHNGSCEDCVTAFPGASACSTTTYKPTTCSTGYTLKGNACEEIHVMTAAEAQALADAKCVWASDGCIGIPNDDGTVSVCEKRIGKIDSETGKCISNGTREGYYERIYDADGNEIGYYQCRQVYSGYCSFVDNKIPTDNGSIRVERMCVDNTAITKDGVCSNGYLVGVDRNLDLHGNPTSDSVCSLSAISITTGKCSTYTLMRTYENSYDTNGNQSYLVKSCTTASADNPVSTCSPEDYQSSGALQYNETGTAYKRVGCFESFYWTPLNPDGTCPRGYSVKSYDSATGEYTPCTSLASVNWETATCK